MDVALIQWPSGEARRAELASRRAPRLLLVEPGSHPPVCSDEMEDWVRLPAAPDDVKARIDSLITRNDVSQRRSARIDGNGTIHYRSSKIHLSPRQARLMRLLTERFGAVVARSELIGAGWPDEPPRANTLEVNMVRLRRKIRPIGLQIRTVRSRGYLLEDAEGET